jgi:hypothetical protein
MADEGMVEQRPYDRLQQTWLLTMTF